MPRAKKYFSNHKDMLPFFLGSAVVILAALYMLFGALGDGPKPVPYGGKAIFAPAVEERGIATQETVTRDSGAGGSAGFVESAVGSSGRDVVKNANLDLVVSRAEEAADEIGGVAKQFGGFVSSVYVREVDDDTKRGHVTIRVPAANFTDAIAAIKALALKVESEQVNAYDVTDRIVDLEARLGNLRAAEEQLVELFEETGSVEELLAVQRELNNVRNQIERLEAQLENIKEQVEMSTITASLTSEADVKIFGIIWSPLAEIKQAVRSLLEGLIDFVNFIIALVFYLPVLALWLAFVLAIIWGGWKGMHILAARKRKKSGK